MLIWLIYVTSTDSFKRYWLHKYFLKTTFSVHFFSLFVDELNSLVINLYSRNITGGLFPIMRKLLVIFLLVALVPFTVGCNGLWDFDDDDDVVAAKRSTIVVNPSITVPNTVAASIRGQQEAELVTLTYGGTNYVPKTITRGATTTTLTFQITIDNSNNALPFNGNTETLAVTLNIAGVAIPINVEVTNVSTASSAVNNETVTITIDNGTFKVVTGDTTTQGTPVNDTTATVQYIKAVQYAGVDVSVDSATPTTVNSVNPTFLVTFAQTITTPSAYSVKVTNETSKATMTLDQTAGVFTLTNNGKSIAIKVGSATGKALKAGQTYSVEVVSTGVANMNVEQKFYFKTATTTFPTTTINSVSTPIATTSAQVMTLTFSADVAQAPVAGSEVTITKQGGATVTLSTTDSKITLATGTDSRADKKVATITINNALTAGTYTVAVTKGAWLDANGNPVEGASKQFVVQ